jgi:TolB-like protein
MYRPLLAALSVMGISAVALGAATNPSTTAFDDRAPVPQTQPANPPAIELANPVVLVLPIAAPMGAPNAWIGRAVQQDMVVDLSQSTRARVIAPPTATAAVDEQSALDQARQANAGFVIYGQAQMSGNQLRVIGGLLDVSTAKPLAALKATAPADNLFPLEDSLAAQAAHALPYPLGLAGAPQPPAQTQQPQQGQPDQYASQPPLPQQNPTYSSAQVSSAPPAEPYYTYIETYPPTYYAYNPYYYPYWGYPYYGGVWLGVGIGGYWGHPYYRGGYYRGGFVRPGFRGGGEFRGGGGFHGGGRGGRR